MESKIKKTTSNINQKVRYDIHIQDNFCCVYCGETYTRTKKLTLDHVYPKSLGGSNKKNNLVTSCFECNFKKGNKLLTEHLKEYKIPLSERLAEFL